MCIRDRLPGDTRQGFVKTYTASTGDMFGIEQVSSAQSGISRPEMRLFTSEEGTAGIGFGKYTNATNFSHQMVIDQDGNVGIGDTSPSYKLDVNGTIYGDIINIGSSSNYIENSTGNMDFYTSQGLAMRIGHGTSFQIKTYLTVEDYIDCQENSTTSAALRLRSGNGNNTFNDGALSLIHI